MVQQQPPRIDGGSASSSSSTTKTKKKKKNSGPVPHSPRKPIPSDLRSPQKPITSGHLQKPNPSPSHSLEESVANNLDVQQDPDGSRASAPSVKSNATQRLPSSQASIARQSGAQQSEENPNPASVLRSPNGKRPSQTDLDEIEESPANAPGSGKRRRVVLDSMVPSSSARLQRMMSLEEEDDIAPSSSPLASKARRSSVMTSARSTRTSRLRRVSEDEPTAAPPEAEEQPVELAPDHSAVTAEEEAELPEKEASPEPTAAEEIGVTEAARTIGKRRPRRSEGSPELGSGQLGEDVEEQPMPRRRSERLSKSPATQKQPLPKKKRPTRARPSGKTKKSKSKSRRRGSDKSRDSGGASREPIEITVQRFVNVKEDAKDSVYSEISFANHSGESVVDVFAQVCEEVIAHTLSQFQQLAENSNDPKDRKTCRIKMRAIEAYREELSSRILQHVSHLPSIHTCFADKWLTDTPIRRFI